MHPFFDGIDTSRQFLVIRDMCHGDSRMRDYVGSEDFLADAYARGYEKILIEIPTRTECMERYRNILWMPEKIGRDFSGAKLPIGFSIVPADARSMELHDEIARRHGEVANKVEEFIVKNDLIDISPEVFEREFGGEDRALSVLARSQDQKVLDIVLSEAKGTKIIFYYGGAHTEKGSILERGIPKEFRTVVTLFYDEHVHMTPPPDPASSDAINFYIDKESFEPVRRPHILDVLPVEAPVRPKEAVKVYELDWADL